MRQGAAGPLAGVKIVEFAGVGIGPFAAMLLAQSGAEVLRIGRHAASSFLPIPQELDFVSHGRPTLTLDLKAAADNARALEIVSRADIVIESYRPGVMERLGLGPDVCLTRNPRLVYGRLTGWGQHGPLAQAAGHDINFSSVTGALAAIGPAGGAPVPPLTLTGYAAAVYLCFGVTAALVAARVSGQGQVVDAAVTDATAHLMTFYFSLFQSGLWSLERGANEADGAAPFYAVYKARDGKYLAVAAGEVQFRRELLQLIGLDPSLAEQSDDRDAWKAAKAELAKAFMARDRDEWCRLAEGKDVCLTPVLDMVEAIDHPHAVARGTFVPQGKGVQPAVAPRFLDQQPILAEPTLEEILTRWDIQ